MGAQPPRRRPPMGWSGACGHAYGLGERMSRQPLILFVLIDALGWDLAGDSSFLARELPERRPLDTVLGFSAGAIHSWRLRQWVKRRAARQIGGYFDLYDVPWSELGGLDVAERRNLFAPEGLGAIGTVFDDARRRRLVTRVWDWRTDDEQNALE